MFYLNGARKDAARICILIFAALFIFYPVFYTEYAYTDELVGMWQWGHSIQDSTGTLLQYGRYITGKLAELLFSSVSTIKGITWIRVFSLSGWLLSIPVWYYTLKKIIAKEKLPEILVFFSVLYLLCTPSVVISVGWAACFELFLANTFGLLSGYFLYASIYIQDNQQKISVGYFIASIFTGILCLFTYQNCFGCFLLPFLLHLISTSGITKKIYIGVCSYFLIYAIYYALFRYFLHANHIEESVRAGLHINIGNKLPFFLARPLSSAFHFSYLFNERGIAGFIIYLLIAGTWFAVSWVQRVKLKIGQRIIYFFALFCFTGLIYLPSLVVKENYASNRTMLPLSMAVFFMVAHTLLKMMKTEQLKFTLVSILSFLFVINAWYNFNRQFLQPVANEYKAVRNFVETNYYADRDTVYFIRPPEDFFINKYGVTRSWDEFGVPSTFFGWTPEFLTRQIVLEKTGKREIAEKMIVKSWLGSNDFLKSTDTTVSKNILFVNTEELLNKSK